MEMMDFWRSESTVCSLYCGLVIFLQILIFVETFISLLKL